MMVVDGERVWGLFIVTNPVVCEPIIFLAVTFCFTLTSALPSLLFRVGSFAQNSTIPRGILWRYIHTHTRHCRQLCIAGFIYVVFGSMHSAQMYMNILLWKSTSLSLLQFPLLRYSSAPPPSFVPKLIRHREKRISCTEWVRLENTVEVCVTRLSNSPEIYQTLFRFLTLAYIYLFIYLLNLSLPLCYTFILKALRILTVETLFINSINSFHVHIIINLFQLKSFYSNRYLFFFLVYSHDFI